MTVEQPEYIKVADSAWNTFEAETAGQPAPHWLERVAAETFVAACEGGFKASYVQWIKEIQRAGHRVHHRRVDRRSRVGMVMMRKDIGS